MYWINLIQFLFAFAVSLAGVAGGLWWSLTRGGTGGIALALPAAAGALFMGRLLYDRWHGQKHAAEIAAGFEVGDVIGSGPAVRPVGLIAGAVVFWVSAWLGHHIENYAWFVSAIGGLLFLLGVLQLAGVIPKASMKLEADGLRIETKHYSYLLEWENIGAITFGEIKGNAFFTLGMKSDDRVVETLEPHNDETVDKLKTRMSRTASFHGNTIEIPCGRFDIQPPVLVHVFERFVNPKMMLPIRDRLRMD